MNKHSLIALALGFCTVVAHAQTVRSVTIVGSWGGLGTPAKSELTLGPSNNGEKTPELPADLKRLIVALREPVLGKPSAPNLGIDEKWLSDHVAVAGKNASGLWYEDGTDDQRQFFRGRFIDRSTLQARLNAVYAGSHTDDYPAMSITVQFVDGGSLTASSHSQNPLMLPWCVGSPHKCTKTYNAHISEAIFRLLPKDFTDRERLQGGDGFGDLAPQMGLYMAGPLEREWNMIGVRDRDPASLKELQSQFAVRYADINSYNDFYFNQIPNTGKVVDENLQVVLWQQGWPKNFVIAAKLLRRNGATEGVDQVIQSAGHYAQAVLDVPWLRGFLLSHPKESVWIAYVHGTSMTDKALRIFADDMKAAGHSELVPIVTQSQQSEVLFETGSGDWWILLPNRSIILWRWASLHPILKWPIDTFPAKQCSDYGMVSGGCAGTLIDPDGSIVR